MAEARSKKPMVAIVKGEVKKYFEKVVEAEERTLLLRGLIREGVGLNEVERFFSKSCDFLRGMGKGGRQEGKILDEMWSRVNDSESDEKIMRTRRGKAREELEKIIGRD